MTSNDRHMTRALELAARGLFTTQPNPRVGCVVVRDGHVVGEGWHQRAGGPHAEVHALRDAGGQARGATAYVSLEPCSHQGRTPPCVRALVEAGVARVVVAVEDPNPKVAGAGVAALREAGIEVETGAMADAARELNMGFFSRFERGRPWLRVKLAMSLDGRTALADGESKWITGEAARADVQYWRARSSAVLTGVGTVLADDPRLTVRVDEDFTPPLRVVLDRALRTPAGSRLLDGSTPTLLLHGGESGEKPVAHADCQRISEHGDGLDLHAALRLLAARGCNEVQVEAGATLCGALFEANLVDELLLYVAPVLLGDEARPLAHLTQPASMAQRRRLRLVEQARLGDDVRLRLRAAEVS